MAEIVSQPPSTEVITIDDLAPSGPSVVLDVPTGPIEPEPLIRSDTQPSHDWWMYAKYLGVLLVLALLGYNLFAAMGDVTDRTAGFLRPLLAFFGIKLGETVKTTASTAADGGKFALDIASGTVGSATDLLTGQGGEPTTKESRKVNAASRKALERVKKVGIRERKNRAHPPPESDLSTSATQGVPKRRGKGGYCYIGEDNGIRSCLRVSNASDCMSGEIFPTRDVCINPNLRE